MEETKPIPLTVNAPECIRKEAITNHRAMKLERYNDRRALAGQAKLGIKKEISPDLIDEIMYEFQKKPPVPVFRKHVGCKRGKQRHRSLPINGDDGDKLVLSASFENSFIVAETSDLSLEGFSHVSIVRSLHSNNAPAATQDLVPETTKPSWVQHRNTVMSTNTLTTNEKIARRTEVMKIESQRVLQLVAEKYARTEEMRLSRIALKEKQDLQKIWLLTVVHMARTGSVNRFLVLQCNDMPYSCISRLHQTLQDERWRITTMRRNAAVQYAANKIAKSYKDYKLRVAMRAHIKTRHAFHTLMLVFWSRINIRRRRRAAELLRVTSLSVLIAAVDPLA